MCVVAPPDGVSDREGFTRNMEKVVQEISLANGLTVRFLDQTYRYYGDFYRVVLEVTCDVPLKCDYFVDANEFESARKLVEEPLRYQRHLEKMGVPSTEISRVIDRLITNFSNHSLSYFSSPQFPRKMILAEMRKKLNSQKRSFPVSLEIHG